MAYIIGLLMAALSFLINRALLKYVGLRAIIGLGPATEETAKTMLAYYLQADILLTHVIFGLIEAVYDWACYHGSGRTAALLSIGGHSIFGLLTVSIFHLSGKIWLGLAGGIVIHMAWNAVIIKKIGIRH